MVEQNCEKSLKDILNQSTRLFTEQLLVAKYGIGTGTTTASKPMLVCVLHGIAICPSFLFVLG